LQANPTIDESGFGTDANGLSVMADEGKMDMGVSESGGMQLDMSGLGPDGLELEGAHDMSQLDGDDALMGGPMMDSTMDPFGGETQ